MAITSNISTLLKYYASKQNSPFVIYRDFCEYIKRYAQHNVEEQPDLVTYLGNPEPAIEKELVPLVESKLAAIIDTNPSKKIIFVTGFFITKFAERYKEIQSNASIPFPTVSDLPKQAPLEVLNKQNSQEIILQLMDKQEKNDKQLYSILLPNNVPPVLFPGNVPVSILIDAVMEKIRRMLKKEEYHDYYLKKLRISNPGKEISAKNFFNSFLTKPDVALRSLESTGDSFYFWNQLCYFIKQDYEKVKDFTSEDINVLQSVYIAEIVILFYKNAAQQNLQRESAIKTLQLCLTKPPYYFTMDTILKFTDTKGIPLYGQFNDQDLKQFLQKETTEAAGNDLPKLLVFKIENGTRYFIYKNNVIPLIIRLASDAHTEINDSLTKEWFKHLQNFDKLPEMTEEKAFNEKLEMELREKEPVLYSLLTANFLPVLNMEMQDNSTMGAQGSIFEGDEMMSYAGILQLNRNEILENARILLPIWYTIPILSWIIALFTKKKTKKPVNKKSKPKSIVQSEEVQAELDNLEPHSTQKPVSKKDALIKAAKEVEREFVPSGATLESELVAYRKQWNKMISKQANSDLTEDVNALIRDYMRKVLRTLSSKSFTADRIRDLAATLADTPNMKKISEPQALLKYIELYMVYLVKNM
ncbi:MAG: hypothetical protein J6X37_03175 [Treponema sp.]|uniref:hypothetical protein n=1 Tax=Treponema sp. TaxID=166 RepID=UPI001B445C6E|nr:hypothetical protein [Treponema sp.]MBP5587708.1 hypothetical protein [Treponema sp.]MCR5386523.1 hypothetical protein [Treponema sp.]